MAQIQISEKLCLILDATNVYQYSSSSSKKLGSIKKGKVIDVLESATIGGSKWYKFTYPKEPDYAWVAEKVDGTVAFEVTVSDSVVNRNNDPTVQQYGDGSSDQILDFDLAKNPDVVNEFEMDVIEQFKWNLKTMGGTISKLTSENLSDMGDYSFKSILGMPYHYKPNVDPRIGKDGYGSAFTELILMDMPVATIVPGGPKFLQGRKITKDDRAGIVGIMSDLGEKSSDSLSEKLESILGGKNARFYSFMSQTGTYQDYANTFCRLFARYAQLENVKYKGTPLTKFNYTTDNVEDDGGAAIRKIFGDTNSLNVYYVPESTGESASNQTTEPAIAGVMNSASAAARDADVLFGAGAGVNLSFMSSGNAEENISKISSQIANNDGGGVINTLLGRGQQGFTTVLSGANLLIPDIWSNSNSGGNTFDIKIRCVAPYGDNLSIFWTILRPLGLLMPACFPRQFGANGYCSPFIVQCFSKGQFNCEMGIVESMRIQRCGSGEMQSFDNLPTEVEITLTIKDLYPTLSITKAKNFDMLVNNIGLIDFVASFTGTSMNKPEPMRKLALMVDSKVNSITDIPTNIKRNVYSSIRDTYRGVFNM